MLRRVLELGTDEVELKGYSPVHDVPDEDPVCPMWQTLAGERGQGSDEIQAVWFDPVTFFPGPRGQALHQQPVGASDVEEGTVSAYRRDDGTSGSLPASLVATKPRFSAWITRLEVSPLQQNTSPLKVSVVVDVRQFRSSRPY